VDGYDADADSKNIGYNMAGVAEKGEAVAQQTADHLRRHYEDRHKKRDIEAFVGA
jgi:hypothetical protein